METACLVKEDGCEVDASMGCKAEGKSTLQLSPSRIVCRC